MSALLPAGARRRGAGSSPLRRQRGIAMLVAILLVALGTIIATAVAYESAMAARRGSATFGFDEALLVGQGAEALAAFGLKSSMQMSKAGTGGTVDVYPGQPWAQPTVPLEVVPGITLEASLEDMQGRFNLNWLVDYGSSPFGGNNGQSGGNQNGNVPNNGLANNGLGGGNNAIPGLTGATPNAGAVRAFNKLLQMLNIDPKWTDMIVDWIDSDNMPQTQGAEDSAYLGQTPPYLAANRYLTSTSELLALPKFGRENFAKLAPYISALPPATALNVCTAPAQVLDAFATQTTFMSDGGAGLAKNREAAPGCFPELTSYKTQNLEPNDLQLAGDKRFGTSSQYFRLTSLVTIGSSEFNLYSLLYMENPGYLVHPVQRSFSPD
jgi:general secretion pathway protein K